MDWKQSALRLRDWFRDLATNPYFWGGLGALFVIGVGTYFFFDDYLMPDYTRHGVSVEVPDVENMEFEQAQSLVSAQGLQVERQEGRYNPNVPQGRVVDQNPPPNTGVKPGRRVYLTVNSGEAPTVSLPDLTGTSLREARNRLTSLGLQVGRVRVDSIPSPYPQTVTRQRPAPGDSLQQGKTVDLWYSEGLGSQQVTVPDVRGLRVERARRQLLRQKLRYVVIDPNAASESEGAEAGDAGATAAARWVRQQGQAPGSTVRAGTEIRLFTTTDSTEVQRPASGATGPEGAEDEAPADTARGALF
jgi:beta-lactam-binding protein with PASTA domain